MRQRRARATSVLALPTLLLGTGLLTGVAASTAGAQRVASVGEDAYVLPRGVLRVTVAPTFEAADQRFRSDGTRERLAASVGGMYDASRLGVLVPGEQALRSLTGSTTARLSFGTVRVVADQRAAILPVGVEFGLGARLQVGVLVPLVRTTANAVGFADGDTLATAGLNPAQLRNTSRDTNTTLVTQLLSAASARETAAGVPSNGCATSSAPACALVNETRGAATALATLYGTNTSSALGDLSGLTGSAAVPRRGTSEATAVDARIAQLRDALGGDASGITYARPAHADAPLTASDLATFIGDQQYGLGLDSFRPVQRTHIGDVEVAAKLKLIDGIGALGANPRAAFGLRAAVTGVYRAPTGQAEQPGNALDLGTGDGQADVEVRGALDVTMGRAFWISGAVRMVRQLEDEQFVRAPLSIEEGGLAPASATVRASRDLGDAIAFEVTPRWIANQYLAIAGIWQLRRKEADVYALAAGSTTGTDRDVALLGAGTKFTEQRAGFGVTWSTLNAARRGKRVLPLDVSLQRLQSVRATGGVVPLVSSTQLRLRLWWGASRDVRAQAPR
jgi:hypothetical protein